MTRRTLAGLDVSTFAIDVVLLSLDSSDPEPFQHFRVELRHKRETGDLALVTACRRASVALARLPWQRCALAYIEAPIATARPGMVTTVIKIARVQGAAIAALPAHIEVNEIAVSDWRKRFTGRGSYPSRQEAKDAVAKRCRQLGVHLPTADACDAYGIAYAARAWNHDSFTDARLATHRVR
jgi:hypothetical protein